MSHNKFRLSQTFGNLSGSVIRTDKDGWQSPPICKKHKFGLGVLQNWFESEDWKSGDHCPRCTLIEGKGDLKDGYIEIEPTVYFPKEMVKSRLSDYNIKTMHNIGQGADGSVYFIQKISDPSKKYAMKMCKIGEMFSHTEEKFLMERDITKMMSDFSAGPHMYQNWIQRNVKCRSNNTRQLEIMPCGFIIMELLEETLHEYFRSGRNTIPVEEIKDMFTTRLVDAMVQNNIENPDIHFNNIMFGTKDDVSTLKIIDWSRAEVKAIRGDYERQVEIYRLMFETNLSLENLEIKPETVRDLGFDFGFGVHFPRTLMNERFSDYDTATIIPLSHNGRSSVYAINQISTQKNVL